MNRCRRWEGTIRRSRFDQRRRNPDDAAFGSGHAALQI
jgi:hypothetical protein